MAVNKHSKMKVFDILRWPNQGDWMLVRRSQYRVTLVQINSPTGNPVTVGDDGVAYRENGVYSMSDLIPGFFSETYLDRFEIGRLVPDFDGKLVFLPYPDKAVFTIGMQIAGVREDGGIDLFVVEKSKTSHRASFMLIQTTGTKKEIRTFTSDLWKETDVIRGLKFIRTHSPYLSETYTELYAVSEKVKE